jgi:hypothetical protein
MFFARKSNVQLDVSLPNRKLASTPFCRLR